MSSQVDTAAAADALGARQLARGIRATWWYTASAIIGFEFMLVALWTLTMFGARLPLEVVLFVSVGGLLWCASTVPLLLDYRHRLDAGPGVRWRRLLGPLLFAAAFGVTAALLTGSWLIGLMPFAQSLILLDWPRGVRIRVTLTLTLALGALWFIDVRFASVGDMLPGEGAQWWLPGFYSFALPIMSVSSLWWWDVLVTLDRARAAEGRLAATQERLRVATDVHDLQGHHLQVIALQLELAERLLERDPDGAAEQLRAARISVDDARQGTRDLATRFRSVPLRDELANAQDLLRAAGLDAEAAVSADADGAPVSVLGPVIRETTTNVLRHGGGRRARLSLARAGDGWRYEIVNDAAADSVSSPDGSGLEGIGRRVAEAGGALEVIRGDEEFRVVVTVPVPTEGAR